MLLGGEGDQCELVVPCVIDQFSCSRTGLPCDGPVLVLPRDVGYVLGEGHTLHILFDLQLPVFIACGVAPLDYVQAFQITDSVKFFRGLVYCASIAINHHYSRLRASRYLCVHLGSGGKLL